jgi:hypothetical protein
MLSSIRSTSPKILKNASYMAGWCPNLSHGLTDCPAAKMIKVLVLPFLLIGLAKLVWSAFRPFGHIPPASARVANTRRVVRQAGLAILVVGLAASAAVWVTGGPPPKSETIIGYEVGPGYSYPITESMSKRYQDQMRSQDGNFSLSVDEFSGWVGSFFRTRRLAVTLTVLCSLACTLCFLAARLIV